MKLNIKQEKKNFGIVWFINNTENTFRFALYQYNDDKNIIYLSNVFVPKKHRGKGLGNVILKSAQEIAKNKNAKQLFLKVKKGTSANSWYERHGYRYHSDGKNGYIWMFKDI